MASDSQTDIPRQAMAAPVSPPARGAKDSSTWAIRIGSFLVPLGHAAAQNVVTVLGLRFLTDNLALSATVAGLMFAAVKIYDAITDPLVGTLSDGSRTRWGRRLPFLFAGGIAMPLGLALLFGTPDGVSIMAAQALVLVGLLIHATGYTLLTIPGFAMVIEASTDPHERTKLMSYRTYGNAVGTLIGTTMPAWLLTIYGAGRSGHLVMALAVGAIVLVAIMLACRLLRDAPRTVPPETGRSEWNLLLQWKLAWGNLPFRILAITHVFLLFGTAIGTASLAYFTRYVLASGDGSLGTYFAAATVGTVGAMPVWVWLSRKFGKKQCYMAAMAIFGTVHLTWLGAGPGTGEIGVMVRALLSGLAGGGMILNAYAMLSDAVRYDFIHSGQRREGAFAGFTTLLDKLSAAAALAVMGGFLSAMGYRSSTGASAIEQGGSALWAITMCVSVIPALAMLAAILVLSRYRLDPDELRAQEENPA